MFGIPVPVFIILSFALCVCVLSLFLSSFGHESPTYHVSEKQSSYLDHLISKNNTFRARPITRVYWEHRFDVNLPTSTFFNVQQLIQCLKAENAYAKNIFSKKSNQTYIQKKDYVSASDLKTLSFCTHALSFHYQGQANQNILTTNKGTYIHESKNHERNSSAVKHGKSKVLAALQTLDKNIVFLEYLKKDENIQQITLRNGKKLKGKADAMVHYKDKRKAILELKTLENIDLIKHARQSDILQTAAYHKIYSQHHTLNDTIFVCYQDREEWDREPKLFSYAYQDYDSKLRADVTRLFNIKEKPPLKPKFLPRKCPTCSFRKHCQNIKT